MTYVREVPASRIDRVETAENDLEQELRYHEVTDEPEGRWWVAGGEILRQAQDDEAEEGGPRGQEGRPRGVAPTAVMVHYAINRPVGCVRGQGDLAVILDWLGYYKGWLEDRVRVNKYKSAYIWQVTLTGASRAQVAAKKSAYAIPPSPGSILVTDENEKWDAVVPELQAWDAESDGKAIRLMVAAGAGLPLHFLSEGEAATRATAAEMGDPTFRHFEHRQRFFCSMLVDLAERCVRRAKEVAGRGLGWRDLKLSAQVQDLTKEDNQKLADAAYRMVETLRVMRELGWIDKRTAMEIVLRFAGEQVDINEVLAAITDETITDDTDSITDDSDSTE